MSEWGAETVLRFKTTQWVAVALLDVGLRSGFAVLATFGPLLVPTTFRYSLIHLALLIPIGAYLSTFEFRPWQWAAIVLTAVNVLFLLIFMLDWLYSVGSGLQTFCNGFRPDDYQCLWIDGRVTWHGLRYLAVAAAIQLAINIVPFLIAWPFSPHWNRRMQNPESRAGGRGAQ